MSADLPDLDVLVERLKAYQLPKLGGDPPIHAQIMKTWDDIRAMLLEDRNRGSGPRDVFEALLSGIYEDFGQAASEITRLREELAGSVALMADQSRRLDAWQAQASENDTKALAANARALSAETKVERLREALALADEAFGPWRGKTAKQERALEAARAVLISETDGSARASRDARSSTRPDEPSVGGKKTPQPNSGMAFGILSPYGDVWSHAHYDTPEAAAAYLTEFWKDAPQHNRGFKIIPVEVTVSAISTDDLTPAPSPEPRQVNRCHADRDGDCVHADCPQLRDGEPKGSGRHCPLDGGCPRCCLPEADCEC